MENLTKLYVDTIATCTNIQLQHTLHENFLLTKNGVAGVHGNLVFRCIADQSLGVGEGYVARCSSVTLIIGDDFDFSVLKDTHAGIRGAQVNSNCRCFRHCYPPLLRESDVST